MTDRTATLNFSDGSPSVSFPILTGTIGPGSHRHPHAVRQDRQVHLRPGLPVDRVVQLGDHLHRRRQGRAPLPRLSDRGARDALRLPRDLLPAAVRRAARRSTQKDDVRAAGDPAHDGQRADAVLHARLPPRRASDGGADRAWSARCRAFYPDSINLHDAQQRDISAIRLIAKMPTLVAMAYKYSVGQPYIYPRTTCRTRRTSCA